MISFTDGLPHAIDGQECHRWRSSTMNKLAGAHGVGRIDMVEDRLVGIKSREIYEAPGAMALIAAHAAAGGYLSLGETWRGFKRMARRPAVD